jgi:hypothetical protein
MHCVLARTSWDQLRSAIMESAYASGSVLAWESGSRSLSERRPRATASGVVPQREPGLRTLHSDAPNG